MSNVFTYPVPDLHGSKDNEFHPDVRDRKNFWFDNKRRSTWSNIRLMITFHFFQMAAVFLIPCFFDFLTALI